jgi:hypothetical protein
VAPVGRMHVCVRDFFRAAPHFNFFEQLSGAITSRGTDGYCASLFCLRVQSESKQTERKISEKKIFFCSLKALRNGRRVCLAFRKFKKCLKNEFHHM